VKGEVVQLKSGGPLMTVETSQPVHHFTLFGRKIERAAYVPCVWFDSDSREFLREKFAPEQLQTCPSMSGMSFKDLRNFELEATARRITK
jgi:uncharacterized protein YodC (DUF2158 family)